MPAVTARPQSRGKALGPSFTNQKILSSRAYRFQGRGSEEEKSTLRRDFIPNERPIRENVQTKRKQSHMHSFTGRSEKNIDIGDQRTMIEKIESGFN